MKIRLGIEKNVEKKRKKNEKNTEKKRKQKRKGFFKNWLKIGHFGGLRPGTTKNEKQTKTTRKKLEVFYVF